MISDRRGGAGGILGYTQVHSPMGVKQCSLMKSPVGLWVWISVDEIRPTGAGLGIEMFKAQFASTLLCYQFGKKVVWGPRLTSPFHILIKRCVTQVDR